MSINTEQAGRVADRGPRVRWLASRLGLAALVLSSPHLLFAAPVITSISPPTVVAGSPGFVLQIKGSGFAPNEQVLINGIFRLSSFQTTNLVFVTMQAADVAVPGTVSVTVVDLLGFQSNTMLLTVTGPPPPPPPSLPPPPSISKVGPPSVNRGTSGFQLTIQGANFRPGAQVILTPPKISASGGVNGTSVDNTIVVNGSLILTSISVQPAALAGSYRVDVVNADATTSLTTGTSRSLTVTDQNLPGATLTVGTIALTSPRNGSLVPAGEELFGEAVLAGSGSGTVSGAWVWDGNVIEQFNAVISGGTPIALRSQHSFPTMLLGLHTVELRILQPNLINSRPLTVIVSPQDFKTEQILGPKSGTFAASSGPPLLRWTPVPGAAKYQVGFSGQPYFSTVTTWLDVERNEWRVPATVWNSLPEGEIYWTVRTVEMSGSPHKPLPMRLLLRYPAGVLSASTPRPAITREGNVLLDWQPLPRAHLYQITISKDPQGDRVVRRYLTATPSVDLRALKAEFDSNKTFYWHAEAMDRYGRVVLSGEIQPLELTAEAGNATPGAPPKTASPMVPRNPLDPVVGPPEITTIVARSPGPDTTVTDGQTSVVIEFHEPPEPMMLSVLVDEIDVTPLAKLEGPKLSFTPPLPFVNGDHRVKIVLGREMSAWKFTVTAREDGSRLPARAANDAEPVAAVRTGQAVRPVAAREGVSPLPGTQMRSQVGMTTQWVSGSTPDINTITFGQQMLYQQGNWNTQMNGTGLLNTTLGPEAARHSLGNVNNYVMQSGYQFGSSNVLVRFGVLAPSLYRNSQLVTPATPRQGVEFNLQTPAGGMAFYANTDDVAPGAGGLATLHQRTMGVSWDLPLPKKYAEFRVMWLSAMDTSAAVRVTSAPLNQSPIVTSTLTEPGGGDLYGGLLTVHLPHQWSWISEYAWGYNTLDLALSPHHMFGRAWRSGVTGAVKSAVVNVTYFDTGTNFVSPANPTLTATSIPNRSGVNASLSLPTRLGTFTFGEQFARANVNSTTAVEQTMNAITEAWSRSLGPKTVLAASIHETYTASGDVPAALQQLPPETLLAQEADQRDYGATLTATRQVAKTLLTLSGARDWNRNNLNPLADVITSSILGGANWSNGTFLQINSSFGVNWTAAEKSTAGTTRALTGHFQPAFLWARRGLQVAPVISFNQSRTQVLTGALTNNLTTGQYGGRVTWTMPGHLRFSSLAFEGDYNHNKNLVTGANLSDKVLLLVWTITWSRQQGLQ